MVGYGPGWLVMSVTVWAMVVVVVISTLTWTWPSQPDTMTSGSVPPQQRNRTPGMVTRCPGTRHLAADIPPKTRYHSLTSPTRHPRVSRSCLTLGSRPCPDNSGVSGRGRPGSSM